MDILQIGDKAPEFCLPSDGGKNISLSDYTGKKSDSLFLSEG